MSNDFVEAGYNHHPLVNDNFTPSLIREFAGLNNRYFRSETSTVPELQPAINSTIFISEDQNRSIGATGVIVNFEGRKYILTATHVVAPLISEGADLYYFFKNPKGEIQEAKLAPADLLYDSTTAEERGLKAQDIAIFPFEGDNEGVEVSGLEVTEDGNEVGIALGFPAENSLQSVWGTSLDPLISVGRIRKDKQEPMTPAMREITEEGWKAEGRSVEDLEKHLQDLNIYYEGVILGGNSGCPLVDITGKLIGICKGVRGYGEKQDNSTGRFIDFRSILKDVTSFS